MFLIVLYIHCWNPVSLLNNRRVFLAKCVNTFNLMDLFYQLVIYFVLRRLSWNLCCLWQLVGVWCTSDATMLWYNYVLYCRVLYLQKCSTYVWYIECETAIATAKETISHIFVATMHLITASLCDGSTAASYHNVANISTIRLDFYLHLAHVISKNWYEQCETYARLRSYGLRQGLNQGLRP